MWTADGTKTLKDYHLTAIDEDVDEDETISALVEGWKSQVSSGYLSRYNLGFDQVLTTSKVSLPTPLDGDAEDVGLGNLVADAYRWAASELTDDGGEPAIAVAVNGVLRSGLFAGDITTSQAFDVLSMGVGEDGTSGFPLVEVYLTGKELKAVAEVDASISAVMPTAQLFVSGMNYSYNVHRMFLNRVTEIGIPETSGTARLEDDALYRVVTGMYSAQMLGTVKNKSLGLLSIEPKFSDGSAVEDFADCVLYDKNGNELKEWYALAAYLQTFGDTGIPSRYAADDGRKIISRSWSPIQLLKYPNWITLVTILALALAVGLVVLLVRRLAALGRRSRYGGRKRRFGH
jgi:2',3'-cyclic-nucleotide 2'-phosphodiesterase (5'-nucleotidase family)